MRTIKNAICKMFSWLDSDGVASDRRLQAPGRPVIELDRTIPLIFLHVGCLGVITAGSSATAIFTAIALYWIRMFAVTAFYHRYFSHRTFKTSRTVQFIFALVGSSSVQRGPLWWAAHHRQHHKETDTEADVHSPTVRGFLWSHMGWIASTKNMATDYSKVKDFEEFPELRFINRFDWLAPTFLFIGLYLLGEYFALAYPQLQTNGWQLVVWGFFISTAILFHATASINSIAHIWGSKRYVTGDDSRNNPLLAFITLGEGWHNNHHMYSHCARQGFFWWEYDLTYYLLLLMQHLGLVYDIKPVPDQFREPLRNTKQALAVDKICSD